MSKEKSSEKSKEASINKICLRLMFIGTGMAYVAMIILSAILCPYALIVLGITGVVGALGLVVSRTNKK